MQLEKLVRKMLPPGSLEQFDLTGFEEEAGEEIFEEKYYIELTEKLFKPRDFPDCHVEQKGYAIKQIADFPLRGRKTTIVYKRRKWKVEGQPGIYMRPMEINLEGVKLSHEFAFFFNTED